MRYQYSLVATLWFATFTHGAVDWAQWRGPYQTGHAHTDTWVPSKLAPAPKTVWKVKVGEGFGSPVVAGGKVVYLDGQQGRELVHAVDFRDGTELWKADLDEVFKDGQSKPGPRSTPLVHDNLVYVQSCRGQFKCLKASNGETVWEINFKKDFQAPFFGEKGRAKGASRHGNCGSPVIKGEDIFVAVGSTNGASIVCFNRNTGKERWRSQSDSAGYGPVLYTQLAANNQVIHFTINGVMGLDPQDGSLLWKEPENTTYGRHVITPLVDGNRLIISTHETGLTGIHVQSSSSGFTSEKAWINKESAINISSPVAVGDYLYGLGPKKNIICVNTTTGKEKWTQNGLINSAARGAYAGFVVLGDNILTLTDGGIVALFAADPTEYRELGRAQVCGSNRCNPAYADGQLYFRDERNLYRLDLK